MARLNIQFRSQALAGNQQVHVILPDREPAPADGRYPAVWLFHGRGEDSATWLQHTQLRALAEEYGCAMVMPTIRNNTRYADAVYGDQNWTYISEELPAYLETRLALARDRDYRFAAGFSIGAVAALKLGFVCNERFAAVCGLGGALQLDYRKLLHAAADNPERTEWLRSVYGSGSEFAQPEDRLLNVAAEKTACGAVLPRLHLRCGEQDGSSHFNQIVYDQLQALGIAVSYVKREGGHNREYCDRELPAVFEFLINDRSDSSDPTDPTNQPNNGEKHE